jgi:hypothetical protein
MSLVAVLVVMAMAVDARVLLDHGTHHNAPPVLKPPQPVLSDTEKATLVATSREHAAHRNNAVLPGDPGSNVDRTVAAIGHTCPPGYHIMGDNRGSTNMGKEKYWCHKNDKIYTMSNYQKTLDPKGVNIVKDAVGFPSQTSMFDARETAEENNVEAREEAYRVEHVGQDKTASIIADADEKMAMAKSEIMK